MSPITNWRTGRYDNFTIDAVESQVPSRCTTKPAVGQQLVGVGCGEPAAQDGAMWDVHNRHGGPGLISLRADPTLCIASMAPVEVRAEAVGRKAHTAGAVDRNALWNSTTSGHDPSITVSASGWASWSHAAAGQPGCDTVALVERTSSSSHWIRIAPTSATESTPDAGVFFTDIGWYDRHPRHHDRL